MQSCNHYVVSRWKRFSSHDSLASIGYCSCCCWYTRDDCEHTDLLIHFNNAITVHNIPIPVSNDDLEGQHMGVVEYPFWYVAPPPPRYLATLGMNWRDPRSLSWSSVRIKIMFALREEFLVLTRTLQNTEVRLQISRRTHVHIQNMIREGEYMVI